MFASASRHAGRDEAFLGDRPAVHPTLNSSDRVQDNSSYSRPPYTLHGTPRKVSKGERETRKRIPKDRKEGLNRSIRKSTYLHSRRASFASLACSRGLRKRGPREGHNHDHDRRASPHDQQGPRDGPRGQSLPLTAYFPGISGILNTCCGNHFRIFYSEALNSWEFFIHGVVTKLVVGFA